MYQVIFNVYFITLYRTIGVAGIDATLEEIENFLAGHQWGSVYSFLMNKEGETIFHPRLKPSKNVSFYFTIHVVHDSTNASSIHVSISIIYFVKSYLLDGHLSLYSS